MERDEMTQNELAAFLELLAKLVESTAGSVEEAAKIIRDSVPG